MTFDPRINQIKEILEQHRGKSNQISAGEVGPMVGINEDPTHFQTRKLILQTIKRFQLPVAASSRGYYLISTSQELEKYLSSIDGRMREMQKRKKIVRQAFDNYYSAAKKAQSHSFDQLHLF